ncbi:cadherin-like domain-containing protein [Acinetobacter lwoffii]|uniref:Calx-beta domain-containing protein n=1 Tax=Acinetobacter lwoffii TaxID=28090 RepID=UPI0018A064E4|nr:Calx-beta domain-containing protein [Acinetobacter lwoffii]QPF32246.1 cadherin-like domain-containing protein [Acinetobacter lwoffii]
MKDVLHLSEESSVVLQLSNGRVVEIHGKDLINNDGNFSLNSLLGEPNSDLDKIVNFAKSFQQMNDTEQQNDVVRLDDGRVFKKEGKDYVEIAGESFDGDPDVTQGGHRFVQLTRVGETSVADGIKPLMLNRVLDNIPPLGIEYPILSSVIKPFEHGLGGGSWTPLSPFAPTPNTPPVASDDTYNTAFNTPVALDPLANDTDADGNPLTITAINGVTLTPGTAQQINTPNGVVNIDAQGNITFTPNAGFTGQESFSYSISDGQGGSATATETINVSAAPNTPNDDRPTALVNSDSKYEGNTLVHDVALSNASDTATDIVVKLNPTGSNAIEASDISQVFVTVDGGATWTEIPVATALSATGFTVSHPANETAGKVQIRVVSSQDSVLEGPESYEISVQTPKQVADSSTGTGTGTIVDDGSTITPPTPVTPPVTPPTTPPTAPNGNTSNDDRPTALVNSDSKYEGNTLVHDVALSNASDTATDIVVKLNPTGSNAIEASDISQVFVTVDGGATWTEIPVATALSATGFTVSHPANETAGKVQIRVVSSQDSVLEGPESYEISVQTPKQVADSSSGTGTGTIVDDGSTITPPTPVTPPVTPPTTPPTAPNGNTPNDDRPTALVNSDSKYEGNTLVHDVALSNASDTATDIVVKLNPTGSNAIEASDISQVFVTVDGGATWTEIPVATALSATGFTVSHPANETAGKVQIRVVSSQDSVLEGPESYEISVQTPKQVADSSSGTGTGTIVDDGSTITPPTPVTPPVTPPTTPPTAPNGNTSNDDRPTAVVNSDSKYEGNTLVHDVALSNASDTATDIVVKLNPTGSNAIEASDISQVFVTVDGGATWTEIPVATALSATGFTVSHPANETAGKVQIRVVSSQDSVLEGPESYEISVQTPKQVADSSSGTGTGTIVDDGSTITPPTPVTPPVTPPTTPPTAPNGNTSNDDRPTALVNSDSKYEGNTLVHDVALSNASDTATDIVVKLNPTGSNAIEASDISQVFVTVDGGATWTEIPVATALSATGFTVSHPANETAGKVQIRVVSSQDTVLEGPETYEISVQTPKQVADSSSGTGTGTIVDDGSTITPPTPVTPPVTPPTTPPTAPDGNTPNDDRPTAIVNSDSKYEGNTLVHDVALSNASDTATNIVVKLNPTGSNAIEASDISQVFVTVDGGTTWTPVSVADALAGFTVSHPANETAGKVQIRVVSAQDTVLEGPETYEISVQTPKQVADSSSGTGTGTIVDDGSTITPPTPVTPPVTPPTTPPTAPDGNTPNDDRPTAIVNSDSKYEGNTLVHDVALSNASDTATNIVVKLNPTGSNAIEASDISQVFVTVDGGTTWTPVSVADALAGFTVSHPANETAGKVQIRVVSAQDTVLEGPETYEISVQTPKQVADSSSGTGTGTIVDDGSTITPPTPVTPPVTPPTTPPTAPNGNTPNDDRPTAIVNSDSKYEGNTLVHDVALSNASDTATNIVVKLTPNGTNAIESGDISGVFYTVDGGTTWTPVSVADALAGFTVSHPANETAGKVQIRVVSAQDTVLEGPETYEISVQTPKQVADSSSGTGTGTIVDDGSTITPPTPVTPPVTPPTTPPTAPNGNTPNDDRPTAIVNSDSKYEGNTLVHDVALSNASDTATNIVVKLTPNGTNAIESGDISGVFYTVDGGTTWTPVSVADALAGFTVSHPANETAGKVQIRVVSAQDTVLEGPETYEISVQTPKQVADSSSGTGTGTIVDDGSTITPPTPVTPPVTPPTTPPTAPDGNTPNDDRPTAIVNSDSKYEGNTLVHDVALSNASDTATNIVVKLTPNGTNAIESGDISGVFYTVDGGTTWTPVSVADALAGFTVSHPANETAGKVQIRVVSAQDTVLEGPETYEISVQTPKQVADSSSGTGTGTIVDDGSTITPPTPVTPPVTPPTTPPTAPDGNTPNDDRPTAIVNSDSKYEGNTLVHDVALSNASDTATNIVVKLNPTGSNAIEASDISQVFVTVDGGTTWTPVSVADALAGFTVSHPANETAGKVQIRVVSAQDTVLEGPETYEISVQTPKQVADSSSGTGTGTIVDDGSTITPPTPVTPPVTPPTTPPTAPDGNTPNDDRPTAIVNSDSKYEGNTLVHDVALSNASDTATNIVVKLNPTGSNAIEASDISQVFVTVDGGTTWTPVSVADALAGFTVSHPANETAGKVQIRVVSAQDTVLEGPESYEISVQTPKQVADSSSGTGTGTIVDDGSTITPPTPVTPPVTPPTTPPTAPDGNTPNDDRPTAIVNSDSKYEGNTLVHDVALSNASDTATNIVVKLNPTGSNAIEASDISQVFVTVDGGTTWTPVSVADALAGFTVSHPANETAGKVQIRVVSSQDSVLEGPETYEISVQTPKQVADSSSGTGTGTIVDDGSTITPPTPVTPPVTPPTTPPTAPNGNTPNDDRPTAIVNSDSKYEGNTLVHDVALSNASDTATNIVVKLTPNGTNAIESGDISGVFYTVDGGTTWTPVSVADALAGFTVSHPANETAGKVQIRVVSAQDTVLEGPETYEISVQTPKQVADSSSGTGTGTIVDDGSTITPPTPVTPPVTPPTTPPTAPNGNTPNDDRPTAIVNSDSKYEGNTLVHDVALSNASDTATNIVVKLTPNGTNAIESGDISGVFYTVDGGTTWTPVSVADALAGFTVSHPANETAGKVQIRVVSAQDTVLEGPETYEISVQTPKQVADSSSGTGTGTIVDDGSTITPPTPVTPPVTPPTTPPTAPNGNTPNDDRPTATVTGDTKVEGSVLVHNVTLSNTSETNTTVKVTLSNGTGDTATLSGAGADVDLTPSQINIVIGSTTKTLATLISEGKATGTGSDFTLTLTPTEQAGGFQVRISSIDDTAVESDESYTISVATPKQVAGDAPVGTNKGTITDNDVAAVLNITGPATINEAAGTATYTVTLSPSSTSTVTVNFATANNGTATSGTDYTSTSGTLTFAPGVTTQTITVPILNDHTIESNENYTISLNTPTNATIGTGSVTTTIIDDDVAPVVDLDANNSSGETGADYRTSYTAGSGVAVSIGDTDVRVTDANVTNPSQQHIKSATVELTNAQTGDVFTYGVMPSGITATKVGNTITLTSASGSTLANFEAAIKAVTFKASDTTPHETVERIIKVKVTDIGDNVSNEATSKIVVNVIQAPGQPGGPTNGDDNITGGNGDDIIVSDVGGLGMPEQISAKYNLAFIIDGSGSMGWSMDSLSGGATYSGNTRMEILKDALREYIGGYFMDALDGTPGNGLINQNVELNIGLIPFGTAAGTRQTMRISLVGGDTWDSVNNKINAVTGSIFTNYEAGFNSAIQWFQGLNNAYTDASGRAVNGYVNMTYFLTDGDPNHKGTGSGTSTTVPDALLSARTTFETLVSKTGINSSVSAIGLGAAANKSYLSLFDNTVKGVTDGFSGIDGLAGHTIDAGTGEGWRSTAIISTSLATFETGQTTGLNPLSAWTASGDAVAPAIVTTSVRNYATGNANPDGSTTVSSKRLELDDATQANGQAAVYTSASFTVNQNNAYAVFDYSHTGFNRGPATVVNTEQGTSSSASNTNFYYNSDLFTWTLQKEVSPGVWLAVDTGTNAASTRGETSNVPMSSQFLENGKTYRYIFTVEDKTTGTDNYKVRIDNIRLHYPDSGTDTITKNVGEARTVMTGPELVEVLKSGSVKPNPNGGGNDTVHGGAGHDIIFGDSINTDWLSWAGRDIYDVNAPNGLGSGIAALDKYLQSHGFATGSGGTVESIDRYNFIKANHAAFNGDSINVGGNDILYGDAGNDILYGQGGIDTLYGGDGNDILYGGKGNDVLWGNAGADIFAWAAKDIGTTALPDTDTIKDFNKAEGDKIDAKALLNALGWTSGSLSDFVSVTGNTINIHDVARTQSVNIVVENHSFSDISDMITKTNFQT